MDQSKGQRCEKSVETQQLIRDRSITLTAAFRYNKHKMMFHFGTLYCLRKIESKMWTCIFYPPFLRALYFKMEVSDHLPMSSLLMQR